MDRVFCTLVAGILILCIAFSLDKHNTNNEGIRMPLFWITFILGSLMISCVFMGSLRNINKSIADIELNKIENIARIKKPVEVFKVEDPNNIYLEYEGELIGVPKTVFKWR